LCGERGREREREREREKKKEERRKKKEERRRKKKKEDEEGEDGEGGKKRKEEREKTEKEENWKTLGQPKNFFVLKKSCDDGFGQSVGWTKACTENTTKTKEARAELPSTICARWFIDSAK